MKIRVQSFARFREIFGSEQIREMEEGATLAALLLEMAAENHAARAALFDENGTVRRYIILMLNKKRIDREELEKTTLSDGDELALYPPVAGG
ncbi:MAG: MoaD family protein [Methanocalculus sp. MSAO_Arc1]|uniref:ubiquitin-like small modifier protein 1 n=1 Tax=Methanocalculus TaxID=71151 RepID=UPI000FF16CDD|nr:MULTISPECIES: ubiquitin-like small modifier protein 1 [unclassified Methanocalculus]MCP1661361.1 molybdopterin synthase sulfur carrier subunit [Methanocalculus sp. AMF5]RQD79653.1 MAG: MoaD family protein [Methanocalculus sp. MSAO_Arc1]